MRTKLLILISSIIVFALSGVLFLAQAQNQTLDPRFPDRPSGKQIRVWVKPVIKLNNEVPFGPLTEIHAQVYWQTGKSLPMCATNTFVTALMYDKENGKPIGIVHMAQSGLEGGTAVNTPCIADKTFLVRQERDNETLYAGEILLQAHQARVINLPGLKPIIRWARSRAIDIEGSTFTQAKCYGAPPCPNELPEGF